MTECWNCGKDLDQGEFAGEFLLTFHEQYGWTEDTDKRPLCERCLSHLREKGIDEIVEEIFAGVEKKDAGQGDATE